MMGIDILEMNELPNAYDRRKCPYIDKCPSATGWCNNAEPSVNCISHIIGMYDILKGQSMISKNRGKNT